MERQKLEMDGGDIVVKSADLSDFAKLRAVRIYCEALAEDFPSDPTIKIIVGNVLTILGRE